MKRLPGMLCVFGCAVAVLIGGNYLLGQFSGEAEESQKNMLIAGDLCKIDQDYMDYYGLQPFSTDLPIIMIDTDGEEIVKETVTSGRIGIIDQESGINSTEDDFNARLFCTVKLRGASSYSGFDKPQFRIKLYQKENGKKLNYALCGMAKDSEWVLYGPFLDKTLVRNALVYHTAQELCVWSPDTRFVEVFVNGCYQGLYLAVQPVTASPGRLNLSDYGLASGQTAYIVKRDRVGTEEHVLHTWGELSGYTLNELSVSYPSANDLTGQQMNWIEQDISAFEKALYSDYFADKDIGYAKYIDVDSFVDYYLLNEAVLNHDGGILSTYCYRELGGKLKMALWDYNNAFDNYQWFIMESDEFHMNDNTPWFQRLLQDRNFVDKLCARYHELRESTLSTESMYRFISETETQLADAAARNDKVWGYTFNMNLLTNFDGGQRNPASREEAVTQLKTVIRERFAFLDYHIEDLYAGCIN